MVKFSQIIEGSIEWTTTICFRPFSPKKWMILAFVAFMAGTLTGGFNSNSGSGSGSKKTGKEAHAYQVYQPPVSQPEKNIKSDNQPFQNLINKIKKMDRRLLLSVAALILVILTSILVLFIWLGARFSFIFLEDILKNDASIKKPFRENKQEGNSLFKFNLIFVGIFLLLIAADIGLVIYSLFKLGAFESNPSLGVMQTILAVLPFVLIFIFLIILAAIIGLITKDFVTVIMYKDKLKIAPAWKKALSFIMKHKKDFFAYIFVVIGMGIATIIISGVLNLAVFFGLLFPAGIVAGICYLLYLIVPVALQTLYFVILAVILVPLILFILYCAMCVNLPFPVFFRSLSIKFLGSLEKRYNLFIYT